MDIADIHVGDHLRLADLRRGIVIPVTIVKIYPDTLKVDVDTENNVRYRVHSGFICPAEGPMDE